MRPGIQLHFAAKIYVQIQLRCFVLGGPVKLFSPSISKKVSFLIIVCCDLAVVSIWKSCRTMLTSPLWYAALVLLLLLNDAHGEDPIECRHDINIPHVPIKAPLIGRSAVTGLRNKDAPSEANQDIPRKRSISRCRGLVESISIEEDASTYLGIPIGGVVSIIESISPWQDAKEGEMTPICSGIFVEKSKVLSSAHCVYHQRRDRTGARFWLFGDDSVRRRYFYAVAGKTEKDDHNITVYPLQTACIPKSYVTADNETVTSGQMNDMVAFTTLTPFKGKESAIAEIAHALPAGNELREYILPQYPLDVSSGAQLVIDVATSPLYKTTYFGGTFYSIDLVSWIGSSGGAILDVGKSVERQRPVLTGILMSEGWQVCDSGILPLTSSNWLYWMLVTTPPMRPIEIAPESGEGATSEANTQNEEGSNSRDNAVMPPPALVSNEDPGGTPEALPLSGTEAEDKHDDGKHDG